MRALALDGTRVYSGSFDTRAIVWEGTLARQIVRAHEGAVTAVLPLPGGRFASGGQDGRVAIFGSRPEPLRIDAWHAMPVAALAPWGGGLASGGWDGRILLWDGTDAAPVPIDAHRGQVTGLVAFAGGLASTGADLRLRLWGADGTPDEVIGLAAPAAALATDGTALFVAGADGALRRIVPGAAIEEASIAARSLIAVAASAGLVAAASVDGDVWLMDAATLTPRVTIATGQGAVWALAISDNAILTGGADGLIRRWTHDGAPLGEGLAQSAPEPAGSRGAEVWRACAVCHTLTPDDGARAGPTLHGIFGRRIGTAPGYDYSEALRRMDIVWTPETVSTLFEVGPDAYTPGTRMPEQRLPNPADRAALIDFLKDATR